MNEKYDIFISYRRSTGKEVARPLKEALTNFGYNVFLDFDELNDGLFNESIVKAIKEAPIFMIVLSANSLDRCVDENDWVRREIELALAESRQIVPVNPDKQFTGFPEGLPQRIYDALTNHQISTLDTEQLFKESLRKIVDNRIAPYVKGHKKGRQKLNILAIVAALALVAGLFLSIFLMRKGDKEEDPNEIAAALEKKAQDLMASGKTEKANTYYLQAAEITFSAGMEAEDCFNMTNNYNQLYNAYTYYHNAAYDYFICDRSEKAIESYSQAVSAIRRVANHSGEDKYLAYEAYSLNNMAYVYVKLEDWEKALASIDQAIAIHPGHANYWDSKGEILFLKGDTAGAKEALAHILEIDPYYNYSEWAKTVSGE